MPILVAFLVRTVASIINRFILVLPFGSVDSVRFEHRAWVWSQSGCGNLGEHLNLGLSYVHSWVIGNIYACTDRAPLVFQSISVVLGVLTVYLVGRIAEELWDRKAAVRAMWVAAFFPVLVMNAAVPLREAWFTTFFLFGVLFLVRWIKLRKLIYIVPTLIGILLAGVIHGSAIIALFVIVLVTFFWSIRQLMKALINGFVQPHKVGAALFFSVTLTFLVLAGVQFSSVGSLATITDRLDRLYEQPALAVGGSAYPDYMIPRSAVDIVALTPIRMTFFLFGPPVWEVRSVQHLIVMVDGLLYLALTVLIIRYRHEWMSRSDYRILLLVLVALTALFAWGVSHYGAGLRHRGKLVCVLIAMGAGFLGSRRWRQERFYSFRIAEK